jgi:ATP-dependent DNA ligase
MLAMPARDAFDSQEHIFELMWGGVRAMAHVYDGRLRLIACNGVDIAPYFPEFSHIPGLLQAHDCILDGEIVATDTEGHPAFDALRPRLQLIFDGMHPDNEHPPIDLLKPRRIAGQLSYQAFDMLWHDGRSMTDRPLWQRKNRLHESIRATSEFQAVDFVSDEGVAFFDAVLQRRLDGIVAKQKTSTYAPGVRSRSWLEVRALQSGDFVVGGYTFGGTHRKGDAFGQILLGGYADGQFEYIGSVSGGLTDIEARHLVSLLEPLVVDDPAFADPPPIARLIYWTRPEVVCRVRFSEWSPEGFLRFPIFSALRPDLSAADCLLPD